jgi:hypothetical protein
MRAAHPSLLSLPPKAAGWRAGRKSLLFVSYPFSVRVEDVKEDLWFLVYSVLFFLLSIHLFLYVGLRVSDL